MSVKNPVLFTYKGVNVRQYNHVKITVPPHVFQELIDAVDDTNMSMHKVLYFSSRPCERCEAFVTVYDKDGNAHRIKRGLFNLPDSNGVNIVQKAKNRNHEEGNTNS